MSGEYLAIRRSVYVAVFARAPSAVPNAVHGIPTTKRKVQGTARRAGTTVCVGVDNYCLLIEHILELIFAFLNERGL